MQSKEGNEPDCLLTLGNNAALFARRVRRAHMQVAQIAQHGLIFIAHAAREIRIIQMLVARRLGHILQHAQTLLNRPPPAIREFLPFRRQIIPNVILLFRRQLLPLVRAPIQFLSFPRGEVPLLVIVLDDLSLFLRTQVSIFSLGRWRVRRRRPVRIGVWPRYHLGSICVRIRRAVRPRILPLVLRSPCFLPRLAILSSLFLSLLLWLPLLLLWRLIVLPALRPSRARSLCERRYSQRPAHSQRYQPSRELEFQSHFPVTSADSDSRFRPHPPVPAAASRLTVRNPKSHHNFPGSACSD